MITTPIHPAEILARSLELRQQPMSPEVARFWLELELAADDRERLADLAEKSRQGMLAPQEQRDLDQYRSFGRLVEIMKLKASRRLATP